MRFAAVVVIAISALLAPATAAPAPQLAEIAQLRRDGQFDKAIEIARAGLATAEKSSGAESFEAGRWLDQLATTLAAAGRYDEAEGVFKRAVLAYQKSRGPASAEAGIALARLGGVYIDLQRFGAAEVVLKRALSIVEKARGLSHRDASDVLNTLASLYFEQGRLREAEPLLRLVLANDEAGLGPEHQDTAASLANLAELYRHIGRYADAEPLLKRAVAIDEKHYGTDHPKTAWDLSALASLYQDQERFADSEKLYRRALAIREKKLGDHRETAATLASFADLMLAQGRLGEAEPLLDRALAILTKVLGAAHADTAQTLQSLGAIYAAQGRKALARDRYTRAFEALRSTLGAEHQLTALALSKIASLDRDDGQLDKAEAALKRAIGVYEATLEVHDLRMEELRGQLATVHLQQGRLEVAGREFRDHLRALERALPAEHPSTGMAQYWLARTLMAAGKFDEAFRYSQRARSIVETRKSRSLAQRLGGGALETTPTDDVFALEARAAFAGARAMPGREAALRDAAFAAAQRATFDETARAVAHMASRAAAGNDQLAALLREQQDLLRRLALLDQRLANAIGARDPVSRAQAPALALESAAIGARLKAIDAVLRRDHPAYVELADPRAISIAETQSLLGEEEAVVLPFVLADRMLLFAVTRRTAAWADSAATAASLKDDVRALRDQLDPTGWQQSFMPFDRALSYRLYRSVWRKLEASLQGKKTVFVVPNGPLTSLPFAVLVTGEPQGGAAGDESPAALRETPWLVKRHALVTLPSVSSLQALRRYAAKSSGSEPFAGFGDPVLSPGAALPARGVSVLGGLGPDLNALRSLASLPHTAGELRALAKAFGAGDGDVFLRERASETRVKSLDLSRKRVIAFATHGILAGEFGLGEPGLVLTPPSQASLLDDGYLAASEVARLNLRAEWVILSACNTASGDSPGAKGLSGLARAFFLAGAKSLLVSNWPVWDDVASRITTTTVKNFQANPAAGRAEALRQTMLSLMADNDEARYAHPAAWAPFILAGETLPNRGQDESIRR